MRIAICEDNAHDAAEIRSYLEQHFERNGFAGEIMTYETGEALLVSFSPGVYDIVFLDIYLPGISGIDAARKIRAADPDCTIVFITVDAAHMPSGFALRAASYVVKPITSEQMETALLQCRRVFMKNARYIEVKTGGQSVKIPLIKILYIEIRDKAASVYTPDGVVKTYTSMDELEHMLGGSPFMRCHRSYIINMNYVDDVLENDFLIRGGARVPIRKNGMKEIRRTVGSFFSERLFEEV
ncbi:MAG: LytTR family DNA-binding domain-containing protein [Oscillospiraceae bacterium]|nr:LytTR family DNA-binding domain-containing protein [Oscillospiraceae bacterium]